MKKFILLLLVATLPVISGCSKDNDTPEPGTPVRIDEARKIAWDSFSSEIRSNVTHEWTNAEVKERMIQLCGTPDFKGQSIYDCYGVIFLTDYLGKPGKIEVQVEKRNGKIFATHDESGRQD